MICDAFAEMRMAATLHRIFMICGDEFCVVQIPRCLHKNYLTNKSTPYKHRYAGHRASLPFFFNARRYFNYLSSLNELYDATT